MYMFNWALLVQLQQDSRIIVNKVDGRFLTESRPKP